MGNNVYSTIFQINMWTGKKTLGNYKKVIFRTVSYSQETCAEETYILCPQTCIASPIINISHECTLTHNFHPNPWVTLEFALGVILSIGLEIFLMTDSHRCSIIQRRFAALKFPCAPLVIPHSSQILATTDPFTISLFLSFSGCHKVGIRQYIAFPDSFLSQGNMHVSVLHVYMTW